MLTNSLVLLNITNSNRSISPAEPMVETGALPINIASMAENDAFDFFNV